MTEKKKMICGIVFMK